MGRGSGEDEGQGFPKAEDEAAAGMGEEEVVQGKVVDSGARRRKGSFWGYSVRLANAERG